MRMRQAAVVAGLALGLLSGTAKAAYVINVGQVGSDVVATGSGTLNLTDLGFFGGAPSATIPGKAFISVGSQESEFIYSGLSGPTSFGPGLDLTDTDSTTGDQFAIFGSRLYVPTTYISGIQTGTSTSTWDNTTVAGLGFAPGSYTYTWGAGSDADNLTVNVLSTVPLPASAPMFGAALLALGAVGLGMKRKAAAV